jgi:hypothetical protein
VLNISHFSLLSPPTSAPRPTPTPARCTLHAAMQPLHCPLCPGLGRLAGVWHGRGMGLARRRCRGREQARAAHDGGRRARRGDAQERIAEHGLGDEGVGDVHIVHQPCSATQPRRPARPPSDITRPGSRAVRCFYGLDSDASPRARAGYRVSEMLANILLCGGYMRGDGGEVGGGRRRTDEAGLLVLEAAGLGNDAGGVEVKPHEHEYSQEACPQPTHPVRRSKPAPSSIDPTRSRTTILRKRTRKNGELCGL